MRAATVCEYILMSVQVVSCGFLFFFFFNVQTMTTQSSHVHSPDGVNRLPDTSVLSAADNDKCSNVQLSHALSGNTVLGLPFCLAA